MSRRRSLKTLQKEARAGRQLTSAEEQRLKVYLVTVLSQKADRLIELGADVSKETAVIQRFKSA
jgi:hypothetical protein